jgi:cytoskeletal protein RodZ
MSAVIAVLVVLAAALAAILSTQINQSWPNSATEEPSNVAQSDEIVPVDKPEQKHSHEKADKHSVKKAKTARL